MEGSAIEHVPNIEVNFDLVSIIPASKMWHIPRHNVFMSEACRRRGNGRCIQGRLRNEKQCQVFAGRYPRWLTLRFYTAGFSHVGQAFQRIAVADQAQCDYHIVAVQMACSNAQHKFKYLRKT